MPNMKLKYSWLTLENKIELFLIRRFRSKCPLTSLHVTLHLCSPHTTPVFRFFHSQLSRLYTLWDPFSLLCIFLYAFTIWFECILYHFSWLITFVLTLIKGYDLHNNINHLIVNHVKLQRWPDPSSLEKKFHAS